MKISLDAAMRARDVSQPTPADEIAAEGLDDNDGRRESPGRAARPHAEEPARPRPRGRNRPG